ncbi:acyl-CoA thioesterase [Sinanaerobacter chloroacetimidivorans]|jgi:acyl-CoA thioester hydrolase|uniref:Acyl-CoA thioesterase n=1 Tax=Sinanaerobacter chloroacetimidivorans TaxID=2818044 RepID=A0A8J7W781_9FIRM|nr:thioesterase family protein [Sinanaerobacter chloroacetimidivorans]MBR0600333.1 acyl-CoA thioesterase [Sinanaerobacter chloroacetimidivorans]
MIEHKTVVRVIYADTDAMGVVYHTNYIKWFEIGRTELLRSLGYPYAQFEEEGVMLPLVECSCKYKIPAKYDDLLEVKAWISEAKSATITIDYEIYRKETGELLVTGMTRHAVTDTCLKPIRLRDRNKGLHELFQKCVKPDAE